MTSAATPVERYRTAYRAFSGNGAGAAPAWVREFRDGGMARFAELGFPTTKQEAWRFTSVAPISETAFALAAPPRDAGAEGALAPFVLGDATPHRLVFVNGRWSRELSQVDGLAAGVRVTSLAHAVHEGADALRAHLGRHAGVDDSAFRALNAAFLTDGAFVHVAPKLALDAPLQILYLTMPGAAPTVTHPRTLIVVEREARAAVVETYGALGEAPYWTNAVTEIVAGDGAHVDTYRVQREAESAYHVATSQIVQGRDSAVNLHAVAFGGALARHDVGARLGGPGGRLVLNGLYLLRGRQHVDHHTTIDHAEPHCESHEYFNGVLDDRARSVFTGRILVRPGAQRTDSKQTNNNLLLSGEAHADSQPQLEIYADDVKCTHGSTVGPLDQRALFYLRSRGLAAEAARRLLTYGFGAEIVGRMEVAPLRERLDAMVRAHVGVT
jgi:Fe-S cluster assembly protein SufD